MLKFNNDPRILITRLSAIGDCIHTVPLIAALRNKFPNALIGWATQPGPASLIQGLGGLDELIVVKRNWLKSWRTIRYTRAHLRQFRFDVAIDPQSLTKSSLLGWLSGAKRRIGFTKRTGARAESISQHASRGAANYTRLLIVIWNCYGP